MVRLPRQPPGAWYARLNERALMLRVLTVAAGCAAVLASQDARAQGVPTPTPAALIVDQTQPSTTQAEPDEPATRTDVWDLFKKLRRKKGTGEAAPAEQAGPHPQGVNLALVPLVSSKPSTGLAVGVGGSISFLLGDGAVTRTSTLLNGFTVSVRKQISFNLTHDLYSSGNLWIVRGDNHYQRSGLDMYGLGVATQSRTRTAVEFQSIKFMETVYRRVAPDVYAGLGIQYREFAGVSSAADTAALWEQSPYVTYSRQYGLDLSTQKTGGVNASLVFDDRDSAVEARKGWFAAATYRTFFKGFLGGDTSWQELYLDVRSYASLTSDGRHVLGFWGYGDFVTSGIAPYLLLPGTASDAAGRAGRGYAEGQVRGERLVYGEMEYRTVLTANGFVSAVAILNATTVSNDAAHEQLFDAVALGGGLGLRILLDKHSRTNLAIDAAIGRRGARGLYIGIQETF